MVNEERTYKLEIICQYSRIDAGEANQRSRQSATNFSNIMCRKANEKIALARLEWLVAHVPFTSLKIGCRHHVNVNDSLLRPMKDAQQVQREALLCVVAGVEVQKSFDNVSHRTIPNSIAYTPPGSRMMRYVGSFLPNR